jgi:hypothetical protein
MHVFQLHKNFSSGKQILLATSYEIERTGSPSPFCGEGDVRGWVSHLKLTDTEIDFTNPSPNEIKFIILTYPL